MKTMPSHRTFRRWVCAVTFAAYPLFLAGSMSLAAGGGRVGDGGDWRRIMLDQAQVESANWSNSAALNIEYFDKDPTLDHNGMVYKLVHYPKLLKQLATDIVNSDHYYKKEATTPHGEYTTCAWTNDPAAAKLTDIVFSLDLCDGGLRNGGQSFADRLTIHESVHHILTDKRIRDAVGANFDGNAEQKARKEDQLCDDTAAAIQRVFELIVLNGKPHWRDIENPYFDQNPETAKAFDARGFHVTAWTGNTGNVKTSNQMIVWGGCRDGEHTLYACGDDMYFNDGAIYSPAENKWLQMSMTKAPSPRAEAGSIWTGRDAGAPLQNKMMVWGGCTKGDGCEVKLNDGGIFDPANNTWTSIAASKDSPSPRVHHSVVWTGSKLIVWGGHQSSTAPDAPDQPLQSGSLFDPLNDKWQTIPTNDPNMPSARGFPSAVWTGNTGNPSSTNKMLVWGGCLQEVADGCTQAFSDGAFFDAQTLKWTKLVATGQAPVARHNYSATYVQSQARLYIFGGLDSDSNVVAEGFYLDLKAMRWMPMASTSEGRFKHQAVWAGDKLVLVGGKIYNTATRSFDFASSVVAYIPGASGSNDHGRWTTYKTDEMIPLRSIEHSAVWTGNSVLVWGGQIFDRRFTNTGSQFYPGVVSP